MNCVKKMVLLTAFLSVSSILMAEEIYKKVDEKGTVEFSGQAAPGAKEIRVDPNVVDIKPAPMNAPSSVPSGKPPAFQGSPEVDKVIDDGRDYAEEKNPIKRHEVLDASQRDRVEEASARTVGEATPRHEVEEASPRD